MRGPAQAMMPRRQRDRQNAPRRELARMLAALADPLRLRMLNLMLAGELSPKEFAELLGVSSTIISRHLVYFRDAKIVAWHTRNSTRHYTARPSIECPHSRLVLLVTELMKDDSTLRSDLDSFRRFQGAVMHSWPRQDPSSTEVYRSAGAA